MSSVTARHLLAYLPAGEALMQIEIRFNNYVDFFSATIPIAHMIRSILFNLVYNSRQKFVR